MGLSNSPLPWSKQNQFPKEAQDEARISPFLPAPRLTPEMQKGGSQLHPSRPSLKECGRAVIIRLLSVQDICYCSVLSDSLWPHGLQLSRLPCPSLSPRVFSNSCSLSWKLFNHLILYRPFSPALNLSQQQGLCQIGASASASVLPMNIQNWFPLGLTDFISLLSKGLLKVLSSTTV